MSSDFKSWFHCGRCGALFESEPGDRPERRCDHCGFDPSLAARISPAPPAETVAMPAAAQVSAPERESRSERSSRKVRKRKNNNLILKLAAAWVVVLAVIVTGARMLWGDPNTRRDAPATGKAETALLSQADQALLTKAVPECGRVFTAFLASGGPESQAQFIYQPVRTTAKIARFYSLNPMPKIEPETLESRATSVFRIGDAPVVEMVFEAEDGSRYDAAFRQTDEQWRIDWEAFARYGDFPLPLFLAGSGPDEAEFRLFARERLARERAHEESMSLIFYAPRFGKPGETGTPSPEFLVSRDSPDGRLLAAGFAAEAEGKRPFNATIDMGEPDDMIRVRVRLRRFEMEEERRFEVVKVLACHWYDTEEPGLEIKEAAAGEAGD